MFDTGPNDKMEILTGIGQAEKIEKEIFKLLYFQTNGGIMEITLFEMSS